MPLAVWSTAREGFGNTAEFNGYVIDVRYKAMMGSFAKAGDFLNQGLFASAISGTRQDQLVAAPVPEPTAMLLLRVGLLGLGAVGRKRLK